MPARRCIGCALQRSRGTRRPFSIWVLYICRAAGSAAIMEKCSTFLKKGAALGDPAAQMNLGYLYDQGLGVAQNRSEAARWYRLAADQGEPRAQYSLADLYLRGEGVQHDESAAFAWFQRFQWFRGARQRSRWRPVLFRAEPAPPKLGPFPGEAPASGRIPNLCLQRASRAGADES